MSKKTCLKCKKEYEAKSNNQKYCIDCQKEVCIYCGKEYSPHRVGENKYCSRDCYLKDRFGTGKCKNCGKDSKNRYCSDKCRNDYWNKNGYRTHRKPWYWKEKFKIFEKLGNKCVICGESDYRLFDIDHIDKDKKKMFKNHQYTNSRRLKEWKENMDNLRILCVKCHRLRTWEQQGYGL